MSDSPSSPADWYEDPEDATQFRYWDGTRWTEHRAPRHAPAQPVTPAPQPTPEVPAYAAPATPAYAPTPSYAATPSYPATPSYAVVSPAHAIAVGPLLAGGALLVLAGIGRVVSYAAPFEAYGLALAFSAIEVIGWAGAFLAFFLAGFPARRPAPRVLALVLVGIYLVTGAITIAVSANPFSPAWFFAIVGLFGFLTLGVGIAFGVTALRSAEVVSRLRVLPLLLYVGLLAFGLISGVVNASPALWQVGVVIGGLSGLVPIAVGALIIAFGRAPHVTA